jgi:hypothetical protein
MAKRLEREFVVVLAGITDLEIAKEYDPHYLKTKAARPGATTNLIALTNF